MNPVDKLFDDWYEANFPEDDFGTLKGVFYQAIKTDVAKKAFVYGLRQGLDTSYDSAKQIMVENYLK